jgi:hypothetical protein
LISIVVGQHGKEIVMTRFYLFIIVFVWFAYCCGMAMGNGKTRGDGPQEIKDSVYVDTVAACLVLEAGGEGIYGMELVMSVIKNRSKGSEDPKNWFKVVTRPKQFSCFNGGVERAVAIAKKHPRFKYALDIVKRANFPHKKDNTNGATHYHVWRGDSKVEPYWTHPDYGGKNKKAIVTVVFQSHVFLKNVD